MEYCPCHFRIELQQLSILAENNVDPITLAITTALANLGQEVIKDAYNALKAALKQKFGVRSEIVEAVDKPEEKPDSKARQALL
jgi:hypothetical protein